MPKPKQEKLPAEAHLILSIETSTPACSVALHDHEKVLSEYNFFLDKSHSSLLPGIIDELIGHCGYQQSALKAVAVSSGPGSYTGLRIGLSTGKGLCFALDVPLIQVESLDTLVHAGQSWAPPGALLCPMIDARRMEVYTKLVKVNGELIWHTQPRILEPDSFGKFEMQPIILIGNGAAKCRGFIEHADLIIADQEIPQAKHMGQIAWRKYELGQFEDLASYEPNYLKEFQTKKPSNKLLS